MLTEHPSLTLIKPQNGSKLPALQEQLEQTASHPTILVPIGIVDTTPIVAALQNNAKLNAEALRETGKILNSLRETVESPDLHAKVDELLIIFRKLGANADKEAEVLQLIKMKLAE